MEGGEREGREGRDEEREGREGREDGRDGGGGREFSLVYILNTGNLKCYCNELVLQCMCMYIMYMHIQHMLAFLSQNEYSDIVILLEDGIIMNAVCVCVCHCREGLTH